MPSIRFSAILGITILFNPFATLQVVAQRSQRDPQAVLILRQSVKAMGGAVPTDSMATGIVSIVEGSLGVTGTIRVITRGQEESSEQMQMPDHFRSVTYSHGRANETRGSSVRSLQLERVVTAYCPDFPLLLLAVTLDDSDTALENLGRETLGGRQVLHVRFWKTYSSAPELQDMAEFTRRDLWIDGETGLPAMLAYEWREAGGASPRIAMEVRYSDYRPVSGFVYPFHIEKSFNGTPWMSISIQNVSFNSGLSDSDLSIQ